MDRQFSVHLAAIGTALPIEAQRSSKLTLSTGTPKVSRGNKEGVLAPQEIPQRARVVIVGGGVIGCSVAYHLGHLGWSDVVLIERDRLTSGTTWHAAGLMTTFGSTSETSVAMRMYTRDLYGRLEAETGLGTGFEPLGFIELAADSDLSLIHI